AFPPRAPALSPMRRGRARTRVSCPSLHSPFDPESISTSYPGTVRRRRAGMQLVLHYTRRRCRLLGRTAFCRLVVQELAAQLLDPDRRLRQLERFAVLQVLLIAAAAEADVLLAEQAGGENGSRGVARKLVSLIDGHRNPRREFVVVELDVGD